MRRTRLLLILTAAVLSCAALCLSPAAAAAAVAKAEPQAHTALPSSELRAYEKPTRHEPMAFAAAGYLNPFAAPGWEPGRIDMGMDWAVTHKLPVRAIGNAVILGSDSHAPWPAHHFLYYQLLDGDHAGDVIYVAEHLTRLARAGTRVSAGEVIAWALPGYPDIETGWADQYGNPRAFPCYKDGTPTRSGRQMARFLTSLGAATIAQLRPGSDAPTGRRC
jgi:murein DD-endopeptidase MepM/ murein hydrolase activator NlpD